MLISDPNSQLSPLERDILAKFLWGEEQVFAILRAQLKLLWDVAWPIVSAQNVSSPRPMTTTQVLLTCFAMIGGTVAGSILWQKSKAKTLRESRQHYTCAQFLSDCQIEGLSTDVSLATWEYLMKWLGRDHYPIVLNDSLSGQFGLAGDDLDDCVLALIESADRARPTAADLQGTPPVKTVRDLIAFVGQLPRRTTN